jgi:hypothetical protein
MFNLLWEYAEELALIQKGSMIANLRLLRNMTLFAQENKLEVPDGAEVAASILATGQKEN